MKLTKTMLVLASATAFVIGGSAAALAQTQTSTPSNLTVNATVVKQCVIQAATLGFGNYAFSVASTASTSMSLNCSPGTSPVVKLSTGANAGVGTQRFMKGGSGSDLLSYNLYTDVGMTTAWPAAGSSIAASATSVTVYGSIPANQNLPTGSYTDTVVATIDF